MRKICEGGSVAVIAEADDNNGAGWLVLCIARNGSGRRECCLGCSQFHGDVVYDINAKLRIYTFFGMCTNIIYGFFASSLLFL